MVWQINNSKTVFLAYLLTQIIWEAKRALAGPVSCSTVRRRSSIDVFALGCHSLELCDRFVQPVGHVTYLVRTSANKYRSSRASTSCSRSSCGWKHGRRPAADRAPWWSRQPEPLPQTDQSNRWAQRNRCRRWTRVSFERTRLVPTRFSASRQPQSLLDNAFVTMGRTGRLASSYRGLMAARVNRWV